MHNHWIKDFACFKNYIENQLGKRPKGRSLDRINNNGNYKPGNLRWATREQQTRNMRTNYSGVCITLDGTETIYPCLAATKEAGFSPRDVQSCIMGRRKTHKGATWKKK